MGHKMDISIEQMSRYISPVNPNIYPHLTLILLGIGIFFTAWFFVYEVTSTKYSRDIYKELLVALFAAIFMGFGSMFLLLWVGIYVRHHSKTHPCDASLTSISRDYENFVDFFVNI